MSRYEIIGGYWIDLVPAFLHGDNFMLQGVRYAGRVLMQNKGWTAMVVLTLAVGIGANAAIFTGINAALLRKLPIDNPDNVIRFRYVGKNDMVTNSSEYGYRPDNVRGTFSYPMYEQFRKNNQTLTDIAASAPAGGVNLVVDGHAEIASAFLASGNSFGLLGIKAALGRTLISDDDRAGAASAAVISHGYWTRRFGGNPNAVERLYKPTTFPSRLSECSLPNLQALKEPSAAHPIFPFRWHSILNS
jgi:hypothetical protein